MSPSDDPIIRRFIEDAGSTTQSLGVGRVIGQIYAYLYFSEPPRSLDDMKEELGISKGSASMGVRQLEQWGAAQRVWVKGDRKDFYTANDYFGSIIRNVMSDLMGKRLASLSQSLDAADAELTALEKKELSGEGELLGCQVAQLLSASPADSQPSATQQRNNSTTLRGSPATQQPNNSTTHKLPPPSATQQLNPSTSSGQANSRTVFLRSRVSRLRDFQEKVNKTWNNPIVKMMLK